MESLKQVLADMEKCAAPRLPPRLLAVSKMQTVQSIWALYERGQKLFGENYVQEALPKMAELRDRGADIEWHFIGTLQRNKVRMVVGSFRLIHSVDSLELVQKINDEAQKLSIRQDILLSVNIAQESTKSGFSEQEARTIASRIGEFPAVRLRGFMTMPPLFENPEDVRPVFQRLRQLSLDVVHDGAEPLELSMGTSHDYRIAISEGATLIRLGTLLFGERKKKHE